MIDVNWLPLPGAVVAVVSVIFMFIAMAFSRRPWAERVFAVAGPMAMAGLLALFLGIGLGALLNQSRRTAEVERIKRSLIKKINRLAATRFGGCGATVENENEVCDACNKGPE